MCSGWDSRSSDTAHVCLCLGASVSLHPCPSTPTRKPLCVVPALQRVVLFSADPATGLISLRHYTISTAPSGVKKPLKALVLRQAVPDMGDLQDVADLVTKSGYGSVSPRFFVAGGVPGYAASGKGGVFTRCGRPG